jgi:hypothetical protein
MTRPWEGDGPEYAVEWGGLEWRLRLDDPRPGLRSGDLGPLLGLEGLAAAGRWEPGALSSSSLVGFERRHGRVEATYAPPGWGELTVRAAWGPTGDDALDLEVEVSTRSVGELKAVEVKLLSQLGPLPEGGSLRSVEPRDPRSAALSYDGRESDLASLTTGPPGDARHPWLAPRSGRDGWTYVEMVHPDDASRRVHEGKLPFVATRYGLFGYDLERGVVLRGRLRGVWLPKAVAFTEAERRYDAFLHEPPPLTT